MRTIQLAVIGLLLFTSGCIKLDHTLTLANDGSGSVDMNITIPQESITQLSSMLKLKKQLESASGKASDLTAKERICKAILEGSQSDIEKVFSPYKEYGLKVDRSRLQETETTRSIYIKLDFSDILKIAESDLFPMYGFSIDKRSDNNYVITRPSNIKKRQTRASTASPQNARMTQKTIEGFEVIIRVRTPGMILKTNAQRKSRYTAAWSFDVKTDPNALMKLQNQNFGIVFDGRDVTIPELKHSSPTPTAP